MSNQSDQSTDRVTEDNQCSSTPSKNDLEENWDDVNVASYNPIQYLRKNPQIIVHPHTKKYMQRKNEKDHPIDK